MNFGDEECVLAVIRNGGEWAYYSAPVDIWVMDWEAWERAYDEAGFDDGGMVNPDDGSRGGVTVLDEASVFRAPDALKGCKFSEDALRDSLRAEVPIASWDQVMHLFPVVFLDFDTRRLVSVYSEPLQLEHYVPCGWTGAYDDFYGEIPAEHRYWIDGEIDYLEALTAAAD